MAIPGAGQLGEIGPAPLGTPTCIAKRPRMAILGAGQ